MVELQIVVDGQNAEAAADELSAILADGEKVGVVSRSNVGSVPEPTEKVVDVVALSAVILSIPGAIMSALEIVDRVRKRKKVTQLIDTAGRLQREMSVTIVLVAPNGTKRSLDRLSTDDVMEIAGALGQH
jgi:hypothetical protein